jgi:hypothetical protein
MDSRINWTFSLAERGFLRVEVPEVFAFLEEWLSAGVGGVFSSLIVIARCRFGVPDGGVLIGANVMGVFQQYSEETG